jgi:hypothetical protein
MGRRYVVSQLPPDHLDFVIRSIINGLTDREVSLGFETTFKEKLAKSSIARWREAAGDELLKQYQFARFQANQLKEDLGEKGSTKLELIIGNIEDRLLITAREIIAKDPVKLLQIRMDEENRRLKEREITLKEKQFELDQLKAKALDPAAVSGRVMEELLAYIGSEAKGLTWFRTHAKNFEQHLREHLGMSNAT